jgi:hypothetical protein
MTKTYNGWTNYETWCVNLWLSNEEPSYRYWLEAAEQAAKDAPNSDEVKQGILRPDESAIRTLADQLREEIHSSEKLKDSDFCTDLLLAALADVDWEEIAQSFLEDFLPTTKSEPANESREIAGARFPLGKTFCTPGALEALNPEQITSAILRHSRGDWGLVDAEDAAENELALKEGFRLLSAYEDDKKTRFWIITEADRSVTTVLLPSEY